MMVGMTINWSRGFRVPKLGMVESPGKEVGLMVKKKT
jgi:hypothetical protein